MSEQARFQEWWESTGTNSVILRAQAWGAWQAAITTIEQTAPDPHIALMEAEHDDRMPQPEDPDEWVIQDRVPVRPGVDQVCWNEKQFDAQTPFGFIETCCGSQSDGRMHGYNEDGCYLSVRCRRRDLPKVEQAEPEPEPRVFRVTDGERYLTCQSFRDRFVLIPEDGGVPFTTIELSWHNLRKCPAVDVPSEKPEPQPELQPAEDPDEWVEITDPDHVLRSCDFFQIKDQSWHRIASSVGKTVAGCRYFAEAFRCRRRDLPKVEQKTLVVMPTAEDVQKSEPQPQKTRVRLWKNAYGSVMSNPDCENIEGWQELYYDSEGFYVEGGQS